MEPPKESPNVVIADVKTSSGSMEIRSLVNSHVDLALLGDLPADSGGQSRVRRWRSG
jgi:hypothetical protein